MLVEAEELQSATAELARMRARDDARREEEERRAGEVEELLAQGDEVCVQRRTRSC